MHTQPTARLPASAGPLPPASPPQHYNGSSSPPPPMLRFCKSDSYADVLAPDVHFYMRGFGLVRDIPRFNQLVRRELRPARPSRGSRF